MFRLKELEILGSKAELAALPEGKLLINTINAHSYNTARKDSPPHRLQPTYQAPARAPPSRPPPPTLNIQHSSTLHRLQPTILA